MVLVRSFLLLLVSLMLVSCNSTIPDNRAFKKQYQAAMSHARDGDYETGINALKALRAEVDVPQQFIQVNFALAFAYYRNREYETTIEITDLFIKQHPKHVGLEYAYYLRAIAAFEKGIIESNTLLNDFSVARHHNLRRVVLYPAELRAHIWKNASLLVSGL